MILNFSASDVDGTCGYIYQIGYMWTAPDRAYNAAMISQSTVVKWWSEKEIQWEMMELKIVVIMTDVSILQEEITRVIVIFVSCIEISICIPNEQGGIIPYINYI